TFTTAPGVGVTVKAGCEFDVPVRFEQDQLSISAADYNLSETEISLIELRLS
ncbi:MAG: TIGR02217 family protein, partial [Alphaproteobacteria bacterium]|nr:TIGR02217 family protein [Alphaproteobacteria bacterium]